MTRHRAAQVAKVGLTYATITAGTLVAIDLICVAFGLFPPRHRFGDANLGWRSAAATGKMSTGRCVEFSTGDTIAFARNEDGVRTWLRRDQILNDSTRVKIGVTGDSQTDLCSPNAILHSGVLEAALNADGVPAAVLTYGAGRYSPLQAYLAFREVLSPYHPQVLVLNVYMGNDLYDILRTDDRPHFEAVGDGYRIAPPTWYALEDPDHPRRSRVLYASRQLSEALGLRGAFFRVAELRRLGAQQGAGLVTVFQYIRDLWKAREPSVGYPDAFAAQMLNQQLFFTRFPGGEPESLSRIEALMTLVREENPGVILVMSPLPSYELVGQQPVDSALLRVLSRLPISYAEGRAQERRLYERLREAAVARGWLFVDNLAALEGYTGNERLYNDFDYHLLPAASAIIGRAQAAALIDTLRLLTVGRSVQ